MTKSVFLIAAMICLLIPLSANADDHDEVTIRVMQMDEIKPDSVINRIELPVFEDDPSNEADMNSMDERGLANQGAGFTGEIDARGFEAEIEVQGMQNELSTQGHGK
jgi:hypothetical protein